MRVEVAAYMVSCLIFYSLKSCGINILTNDKFPFVSVYRQFVGGGMLTSAIVSIKSRNSTFKV